MIMSYMVSGTCNIFNCRYLYCFLVIYLFIKKSLSIVQEFNCYKDSCVLSCEALGVVLQARLPFTWVTRGASLFSILNFPLTVYFFGGTTYKARMPHRHHLLNNSKEPPETQ